MIGKQVATKSCKILVGFPIFRGPVEFDWKTKLVVPSGNQLVGNQLNGKQVLLSTAEAKKEPVEWGTKNLCQRCLRMWVGFVPK